MRIWNYKLLPYLCDKHLLACWREAWAVWSILTNDKKGYRKHPQVKQYDDYLPKLLLDMADIWDEMSNRGFNPKPIEGALEDFNDDECKGYKPWQTLAEQIEVIKSKGCECDVGGMERLLE